MNFVINSLNKLNNISTLIKFLRITDVRLKTGAIVPIATYRGSVTAVSPV